MKHILDDLNFIENQKTCGHGTIYNCLINCGIKEITEAELYYLTNGNKFEFIKGEIKLGYNTLYPTAKGLQDNVSTEITWYKPQSVKDSINFLTKKIDAGNLLVVGIKAEGLKHHHMKEIKYPYHMMIVYGYIQVPFSIYCADLYIHDDTKNNVFIGKLCGTGIMENIVEYIVFPRNLRKNPEVCLREKFIKNLTEFVLPKDLLGINVLRNYFEKICRTDMAYLNGVVSFRIILLNPMINYMIEILSNNQWCDSTIIEDLNALYKQWDSKIFRYIKECYLGRNKIISFEDEINQYHKILNKLLCEMIPTI